MEILNTSASIESFLHPQTHTLQLADGISPITFSDNLTLGELEAIADQIASFCISPKHYRPGYKKPLLLYYLLSKMSDAALFAKMEEDTIDLEKTFAIYKSPLGSQLITCWDKLPLLSYLEETVDEKISFLKEQLRIDSRIADLINTGYETLDNVQKEVTSAAEQILELMKNLDPDKLNSANERAMELLNELNPEKLNYLKDVMNLPHNASKDELIGKSTVESA